MGGIAHCVQNVSKGLPFKSKSRYGRLFNSSRRLQV